MNACLGTGGARVDWEGGKGQERSKRKDYKEPGKPFGGDGYSLHLDCGDGLLGVYIYQNLSI